MIRISDKSLCHGCTACMNACPAQCIVMRRDREGFDYPVANPDRCMGCGKCEEVCPSLNPSAPAAVVTEAGYNGIFMENARRTIDEGGVIFGPVMNDDMTVGHVEAGDMDMAARMSDFKCVQSDPYSTFEETKAYLDEGRKVLYCGTPCLIDGLNAYLGGGYENLKTLAAECHGMASPGLWEKCVDQGRKEGKDFARPYMALYEENMNLRPYCYGCNSRKERNVGMPKKRQDFFKGIHSSKDIVGYMKDFVSPKTKLRWLFKK